MKPSRSQHVTQHSRHGDIILVRTPGVVASFTRHMSKKSYYDYAGVVVEESGRLYLQTAQESKYPLLELLIHQTVDCSLFRPIETGYLYAAQGMALQTRISLAVDLTINLVVKPRPEDWKSMLIAILRRRFGKRPKTITSDWGPRLVARYFDAMALPGNIKNGRELLWEDELLSAGDINAAIFNKLVGTYIKPIIVLAENWDKK
jgi:hypothetical protein